MRFLQPRWFSLSGAAVVAVLTAAVAVIVAGFAAPLAQAQGTDSVPAAPSSLSPQDRLPVGATAQEYVRRGREFYLAEKYASAVAAFSLALEADPNNASVYNSRGNALSGLKQYEKAIADYDRSISMDPSQAGAYFNRAFAYDDMGQYEKAIADYGDSIRLQPDDSRTYVRRGIAWGRRQQIDKAIADFDKAIAVNAGKTAATAAPKPGSDNDTLARPYYNRGIAYDRQKQYDKAIADYSVALRLGLTPEDQAGAFRCRADVLVVQGQFRKALIDDNESLRLRPNPDTYYSRGIVFMYLRNWDLAVADFDEALRLKPDFDIPHYNRGYAYANLRRYDKAIADLQKFLELRPGADNADEVRTMIIALQKRQP